MLLLWKWEQEDQKFRIIFSYIRTAWTAQDSILKEKSIHPLAKKKNVSFKDEKMPNLFFMNIPLPIS